MRYSRAVNSRLGCVLFLLSATLLWAQKPSPPTGEELAAITARGKRLTEYDRAAHAAIAAVKAVHPTPGKGPLYVGQKTPSGWSFAFGSWETEHKEFVIGYLADQSGPALEFIVKDEPSAETRNPFFQTAARAIETAMRDFQGEQRPYSLAVIPTEADQLYVYIYPAQRFPKIFPLGGDVRFTISSDGTSVLDKRQMHRAIIEMDGERGIPAGAKLAGGVHSHVLSDVPEDTDVFHVLRQSEVTSETIGTKHFIYQIKPDGLIQILKK